MPAVVARKDLPPLEGPQGVVPGWFVLEGSRFGLDHLTLVCGTTAPGDAIPLHRHPFDELFIVHEGRGTYTVGEATVEAGPGDVVLIPAGVAHRFVNTGPEPLSHTAVHAKGSFALEGLAYVE
jgi:mannose-6-phosphate isomerase-like protein (cupin superfamily)